MKRYVSGSHSAGREPLQQLRGEMQPRGGRGDSHLSRLIGVNGLVAVQITCPLGGIGRGGCDVSRDVGWERHIAEAVGDGGNRFSSFGREFYHDCAVVSFCQDFT